jgi:hypothetical protein
MNPFTERGRITNTEHFIGRWRELSVIFDRMVAGHPVLISGAAGIGKSSLLTHVAQSASVNLERPEAESFYLDLSVLPDAAACYKLMAKGLGSRGDTPADLEVALLRLKDPVVFCLDRAESAIAKGWGVGLLEQLARIVRRSIAIRRDAVPPPENTAAGAASKEYLFLLAVAHNGPVPEMNERFAVVGLGAFAPAEIRLFADAYLGNSGVHFSPAELRELLLLSVGHPAYLQRAAFHLFRAHTEPGYDWRAAYLAEASERPVPGAPLPPPVFEGEATEALLSVYGYQSSPVGAYLPEKPEIAGAGDMAALLLPLLASLLAWQFGGWLAGVGVLLASAALVVLVLRFARQHHPAPESAEDEP